MPKLSKYKLNVEKSEDGVWLEFEDSGIECLIARIGNPRYEKRLRELTRPASGKRTRKLTDADIDSAVRTAIVETVLLNWRNMDDDVTGLPMSYSTDAALKIINDKAYIEFYKWVILQANDIENFRDEEKEEVLQD